MAHFNDRSEIDALKQAEHAMTGERNFNHSLLESMADGVVACDADGIPTLFNRSARRAGGGTASQGSISFESSLRRF